MSELLAVVVRLPRAAGDDDRRKVLAPLTTREILFHLLSGEQGQLLWEVALRDSRSKRVARALRPILEHDRESLDVETIARRVDYQSPSQFCCESRRHFGELPAQHVSSLEAEEVSLV